MAIGGYGNGSNFGHSHVFYFTTLINSSANIDGLVLTFTNGSFVSNLSTVVLQVGNTLG